MAEKYRALATLEAMPTGRPQDLELRATAKRWPGSLRESQLAGPERCHERRVWAEEASERAPESRADWRSRGPSAAAVILWAELHPMLGDHIRWRKSLVSRRRQRVDTQPASFLDFLASTPAAMRWPASAQILIQHTGPRVRARSAYLWLAARCGFAVEELQFLLFGRTGHWDQRPGDPAP
ncbi:MAG: hypothetical protein ACPG77_13020 [Nannocystaceae bacterium]